METGGGWFFWVILIVASLAFMFIPQYLARNRRKKQERDLEVGDRIMTIGGFIGDLVYINHKTNLARIKLADGVVVDMIPGAISGKRADEPEMEQSEVDSSEE
ncbi:MAG: preprotein translocase subunit YajC [Anaerolineae bacterium]|nr:preprotein translocase subunit YajC [Anaerolineae bacterium]